MDKVQIYLSFSGSCFYFEFPEVKSIREYEKGLKTLLFRFSPSSKQNFFLLPK